MSDGKTQSLPGPPSLESRSNTTQGSTIKRLKFTVTPILQLCRSSRYLGFVRGCTVITGLGNRARLITSRYRTVGTQGIYKLTVTPRIVGI
jgi:hypothetical protein